MRKVDKQGRVLKTIAHAIVKPSPLGPDRFARILHRSLLGRNRNHYYCIVCNNRCIKSSYDATNNPICKRCKSRLEQQTALAGTGIGTETKTKQ